MRAEAAEAKEAITLRVRAIADGALVAQKESPSGPPTMDEVCTKLRAAFDGAMATSQFGHAVNAAMALGKLGGLIVDKAQVMTGTPQEFAKENSEEEILANIEANHGPIKGPIYARNFKRFMEKSRRDVAAGGYEIVAPAGYDSRGRWRHERKRYLSLEDRRDGE